MIFWQRKTVKTRRKTIYSRENYLFINIRPIVGSPVTDHHEGPPPFRAMQPQPAKDATLNLVQINADRKEIERRISAFIAQKRQANDELNVLEFCSRDDNLADLDGLRNSCARVDAVLTRRADGKSHLKVSKVDNSWAMPSYVIKREAPVKLEPVEPPAMPLEERLLNIEQHLRVAPEGSVPDRLRKLEERIIFLEGISPEYFTNPALFAAMNRPGQHFAEGSPVDRTINYEDLSLEEIDARIAQLKGSLPTT